jgi:Auxiliary Activity family 9 (formerly GH61)
MCLCLFVVNNGANMIKVHMKKVDSAITDTAAGDGWFKIWDEGYDEDAKKWCTNKVIDNGGFLTVNIPKGLEGGDYLVRAELLSLHLAVNAKTLQYYIGCAQIFVQSTGSVQPTSTFAIPGAVKPGDAAVNYNIFANPLQLPYTPPGPPVANFLPGANVALTKQVDGLKPANCIAESGSNFCGVEVPDYTDVATCWPVRSDFLRSVSQLIFNQSFSFCMNELMACYNTAPATGKDICLALDQHCQAIQTDCQNGTPGPPNKGKDYSAGPKSIAVPAPVGPTVLRAAPTAAASPSPKKQAASNGAGSKNPGYAVVTATATTLIVVTVAARGLPTPAIE